jgi:hypothetical protein
MLGCHQENLMKRHFLTLTSPELLSLAIGVEASNVWRYREWADRFRPYNEAVSVLFDDMADHSEQHGDGLRASYGGKFDDPAEPVNSREVDAHTENAMGVGEHFFVIDMAMARSILTSAVHTLSKLRYFYKTIFVTTKNAILREIYEPRTLFDSGHMGRLNQFLQQYSPLKLVVAS